MNEANWDARVEAAPKILGADYIGSGGVTNPGINTYAAVLASANALNRLGKKSVEAGVGPDVHPQPRAGVRSPVRRRRRAQDRVRHPHGEHGSALRRGRGRRLLVVRRVRRRDGHADGRPDQQVVEDDRGYNRVGILYIKDGIDIAPARPTQQPRRPAARGGHGRAGLPPDPRPHASDRVRYYHQEQDGGTLTDAANEPRQPQGRRAWQRCRSHARASRRLPGGTRPARRPTGYPVRNPEHGRQAAQHHRPGPSAEEANDGPGRGGLLGRGPELHRRASRTGRAQRPTTGCGAAWDLHGAGPRSGRCAPA